MKEQQYAKVIREYRTVSLSRPDSGYIEIGYSDGVIKTWYENYPLIGSVKTKRWIGQDINYVLNMLVSCDWVIN